MHAPIRCRSAISGWSRSPERWHWTPVLLAMDEPAAGLNPSGVDALDDLITRIRSQGVVVLLVEHW
jgi:ABC-type sugar transport system ATPase subunit